MSSFNTSNISADTLVAPFGISSTNHVVLGATGATSGFPITCNQDGELVLGDENNTVVNALALECATSASAPVAFINTALYTNNVQPFSGNLVDINTEGFVNCGVLSVAGLTGSFDFYNLDVENLYINNGSTGYNLSVNNSDIEPTLKNLNIETPEQYAYITLKNSCNLLIEGDGALNVKDGGVLSNFVRGSTGSSDVFHLSTNGNFLNSQTQMNCTGLGNVECQKLKPVFKPNYDFFVCPNGSNSDGNGSLENPWQTIQYALSQCESLTSGDNTYRYIRVLGGNYTENLTITKKVFLVGESQTAYSSTVGCCINGNININIDTNGSDMFNNAVNISGFLVNGCINFQSSENSVLNVDNSYIYTPNDGYGRGVYFNPSSTNSRLRLQNVIIVSGGTTGAEPLVDVTCDSSLIFMNNCSLTAKGNQSCMRMQGTCDSITFCRFESSTNSTTASPIVQCVPNIGKTYSFSNCAFIYSNTANKTANVNSCGIFSNSNSGNNNILVSYNTFFLLGTNNSNFAIYDYASGTATTAIILYYMNNASLNNAFAIRGTLNVNKFQLQVVS